VVNATAALMIESILKQSINLDAKNINAVAQNG
jgi:hypothetical protein